jgi:hypothetical protein
MKRKIVIPVALLGLTLAFTACEKEKDTIATITVKSEGGDIIPGALVRLYAIGSPDVPQISEIRFDTTAYTNGSGKVSFNFSEYYKAGQAGFAVLDIEASKGDLYGTGIIKIEEEETNEELVTVE